MSRSTHITWDEAMEALGVRMLHLPSGTISSEPEPGSREFLAGYILHAIWWQEATPTGHIIREDGEQWIRTLQGMSLEELEWIATAIDANLQGDTGTLDVVRRRLLGGNAEAQAMGRRRERPDRSGDRPGDLLFGGG